MLSSVLSRGALEGPLSRIGLERIAAIIVVALIGNIPSFARNHSQTIKANVRFLATSTLLRTTWGWNRDTYLAELTPAVHGESILVRVLDAYPNQATPLSREVLKADPGTMLRVSRDTQCDLPFGQMLLRTAPGDPLAILLEPLVYQPPIDRLPDAAKILPCYRVYRR